MSVQKSVIRPSHVIKASNVMKASRQVSSFGNLVPNLAPFYEVLLVLFLRYAFLKSIT